MTISLYKTCEFGLINKINASASFLMKSTQVGSADMDLPDLLSADVQGFRENDMSVNSTYMESVN